MTEPCPHCDKPVKEDARKCPHCRRWLDEDEDEDDRPRGPTFAACPSCGGDRADRIIYTFWGSFYGPALFNHVRCRNCRTAYNGTTGKSNALKILIFCVLVYGFLLLLVGAPIAVLVLAAMGGR